MIHKSIMKQRYILFRRAGLFYYEDTTTGKQLSLRTKDEAEARTLLNAKNESFRQRVLNRQIARTYLAATDSEMATRIPTAQEGKHHILDSRFFARCPYPFHYGTACAFFPTSSARHSHNAPCGSVCLQDAEYRIYQVSLEQR
jgi:hypothetical protein